MADELPPPLSYAAPPLPVAVVPLDPVPTDALPMAELVSPTLSAADVPRHLLAAQLAWRPIRRAVRYATFDGWTLALFAALSVPCLVGGTVVGLTVAVGLGVAAAVELWAVRRLRRLDERAVRVLVLNQLGLAIGVAAYAVWNLYLTRVDRGLMGMMIPQLHDAGPEAIDTARQMVTLLYASLAVIGPAFAGGAAWFYATRAKRLRAYLANTPAWVLQMHRERGSL